MVDDKIYIITYKEKNGGSELLVYETGGEFFKRVFVPLVETDMLLPHVYNYYTIGNGKLYVLKDNVETEEWQMRITPLL